MIKAIFFDQDNTLFKTREAAKSSYYEAIKLLGKEINSDYELIYKKWNEILIEVSKSKNPAERTFLYSLTKATEKLNIQTELLQNTVDLFENLYIEKLTPTEGTKELLEMDIPILKIVFTESDRENTMKKLSKFDFDTKIDLILTCSDFGVMKPDIKYLQFAWDKYNLDPKECIYIGDNWDKDCRIGQENGGIGVVFGSENPKADYSIFDMRDLIKIIDSN